MVNTSKLLIDFCRIATVSRKLRTRLREYRRKTGLSQEEVAYLLGARKGAQVSRYEKGHRLPDFRRAIAFAVILSVPMAALFVGLQESVARDVRRRAMLLQTTLESKKLQSKRISPKLRWLKHRWPNT